MVDPVATVGAGAVIAYLSKDGLNKLLGPTADYLGGRVKGLVEKCDVNLAQVFAKAHKKLGDKINEPGVVSPRIVKQILDDAMFCEDEIASEYFGGVLASSRSKNKRDDRGLHYLGTLKQLSVYEIRLHYVFYSLLRKSYPDPNHQINLSQRKRLENMYCRIPFTEIVKAMDYSVTEDGGVITLHAVEAC